MFGHSSREAAKKLGISFASLNRYIAAGKIPLPPLVRVGGVSVRLWSDADIQRVRALLPRIANGRKTRYQKKRKPQPKGKRKT
jgi:predicted DNA-binding transcriptional regulator AlpA